nr:MAG TPA: hypothetical protein [Caudoviricetes sp.]
MSNSLKGLIYEKILINTKNKINAGGRNEKYKIKLR